MASARLDKLVSFSKRPGTLDSHGQEIDTWNAIVDEWHAEVAPLTGNELFTARQLQAEVTTKITIRYATEVAALRPKDRMVWGLRVYDILSVRNVGERNDLMELMAVERV